MMLLMEERRKEILEEINEKNIVYVKKLASKYSVTMETIRKDLEDIILENPKIKKVYGGAIKDSPAAIDSSYGIRAEMDPEEKEVIGRKAAELVEDGDSIFLDAGTTVAKIVPNLKSRKQLKIVTVSVAALNVLIQEKIKHEKDWKIYFIGGEIKENLLSSSGNSARENLKNYFFDKAFLTLDGLSLEQGITSHDSEEALFTAAAMKQSRRNIFMVTGEKFGASKFYKVSELEGADVLISSAEPEKVYCDEIEKLGIELFYIQGGRNE